MKKHFLLLALLLIGLSTIGFAQVTRPYEVQETFTVENTSARAYGCSYSVIPVVITSTGNIILAGQNIDPGFKASFSYFHLFTTEVIRIDFSVITDGWSAPWIIDDINNHFINKDCHSEFYGRFEWWKGTSWKCIVPGESYTINNEY